jgi:regulator of nucleoside diphosphate kinase
MVSAIVASPAPSCASADDIDHSSDASALAPPGSVVRRSPPASPHRAIDMHDLTTNSIIITDADRERLLTVLDLHDSALADSLEAELHRAIVVRPDEVPPDVVTMNSEVIYEDLDTGARRAVRLVYPKDADASAGRISVLAPIGAALLGLRVGQEIEWSVPGGRKRIRVTEVGYQPESAGHLHL